MWAWKVPVEVLLAAIPHREADRLDLLPRANQAERLVQANLGQVGMHAHFELPQEDAREVPLRSADGVRQHVERQLLGIALVDAIRLVSTAIDERGRRRLAQKTSLRRDSVWELGVGPFGS